MTSVFETRRISVRFHTVRLGLFDGSNDGARLLWRSSTLKDPPHGTLQNGPWRNVKIQAVVASAREGELGAVASRAVSRESGRRLVSFGDETGAWFGKPT